MEHDQPPLSTRDHLALRSEAGLLAPGLPVAAPSRGVLSGLLRLAYPVTVAGPRRTCTGFPCATDPLTPKSISPLRVGPPVNRSPGSPVRAQPAPLQRWIPAHRLRTCPPSPSVSGSAW